MTYDIDGDYAVFQEELPELLAEHPGKVALYHDHARVGLFNTFDEAVQFGVKTYELGNFIAQPVEQQVPNRLSYSLMV